MTIAAMKQALEALKWADNCPSSLSRIRPAIAALRAAIEQAEEAEPAYMLRELEEENGGVFVKPYNPTGINLGIPLFTLPAPVPDGWQLVPVEPTHDMMLVMEHFANSDQTYPDGWKAMLQAAPKPGEMK